MPYRKGGCVFASINGRLYRCVPDGLLRDFFEIIVKYTNNTLHIRLFLSFFGKSRFDFLGKTDFNIAFKKWRLSLAWKLKMLFQRV